MKNFQQFCNARIKRELAALNTCKPSEREKHTKHMIATTYALGVYLDARFMYKAKGAKYAIQCVRGWQETVVLDFYARTF